MIGTSVKYEDNTKSVDQAAEKAGFKNISHAASSLRKDVIASIVPGDGPSAPGTPPHTQTSGVTKKGKPKRGKLPRSILFDVDKEKGDAVIGPRKSVIGEAGRVHEFGGEFEGEQYPERAYMWPGLERAAPRLADSFEASL